MKEEDFEGTLVLEKLASLDLIDAFFEAVDADDFGKAARLMKKSGVERETIAIVLKMMGEG